MTLLLKRSGHGISRQLICFGEDRSGNVVILFALMATVLMLAIGAAVDVGRWLHARDQTIAAMDAAVLAGGRVLQTNSSDTAGAIAAAKKFYIQNVATRAPVTDDSISFSVADGGKALIATGTAYIKTPFLQFGNIDKLPLLNTTRAESSKAELAVGGNGGESLEVSMMLDVTGSMAGQKLKDLKDAAEDLINIIVWDDQSKYTSKVALVPFSEDIRLPTSTARDKARGTGLPATKTITTGSGWFMQSKEYYLSDCVVERTGPQKYTDAAPGAGQYLLAHYTENYSGGSSGWGWGWGGGGGSKTGICTVPTGSEVMPLSSNKSALIAKVESLSASGGTAGHLGTAWAWYTLSPKWASLWSADSRPQAYGTTNLRKIAILMTDGEYNTQYDSNGVSASESQAANGGSTTQARALCKAMKAQGITIYTVGFELSGNQTAIDTLTACATDSDKFYSADDGEQLKQAFRDIAIKLSSLYLSK
jgi:Flp pilus assembly protein TadG